MKLIIPEKVAFTAEISEAELRDRLRPAPARLRLPKPEEHE